MEHRRMFWLLIMVLFQPTFTCADCNVTWTSEQRMAEIYFLETETIYKFYIQCIDVSLHTGVPLMWYMSNYASEATKALSIEFSSSTINTVPVGVFQAYSMVETLTMNNVSINSISPGAFSGMTQLQEFFLNNNNITELQVGTFDGLVQLKRLEMSGNNIKTIDDGAFKDTVKLRGLYMSGNQLVNLSATLFSTMPELSKLYLQNNYIDYIPAGIFNTTKSLDIINLSNNTIRSVPCNELMGIVDLTLNRITSLVNCNKHIWDLNVSYNHLTALPAMFFSEAAPLITLDLSHNNISSIHGDAFLELRSLYILSFSNNRISTIPQGTFRNLALMDTLRLSYNNLMDLKYGVFTGLTSLQVLDVSNNKIARLDSEVLFPLKSLKELKLDGNLLRTFDTDTMATHLTRLKSISLDHNQMQCEWLTSCIYMSTLRNIAVLSGDSFTTSNVHGIYCIGENERGNVTMSTAAIEPNTPVESAAPVRTVSNVERAATTPYLSAGDKIPNALLAEHEKTNNILVELSKANSNFYIFATVAVIILIIIILAISMLNMYSIRRINMKEKKRRIPSSCGVELLHVTD